MNYNLLDNEALKNSSDIDAVQNSIDYCTIAGVTAARVASELNMTTGASGTLLQKIVEHEIRMKARNKALINQEEQIRHQKV